MLKLLAFDLGASTGRSIVGSFDGERLILTELKRFANDPVFSSDGHLRWDFSVLFNKMKRSIGRVKSEGADLAGMAIDTWGVDFGLLDANGQLLENPYHYRDTRTQAMMERAAQRLPRQEIYAATGIAFQEFNTLYQLLAMVENHPEVLDRADSLLFMPDLFGYFFSGQKGTEYTIASTSQMVGVTSRSWATEMLDRIGIPQRILGKITPPGRILGQLSPAIAVEFAMEPIPVISVAGHDTASAVVAVPAEHPEYAYLSSGTWSLLGVETVAPICNEAALRLNFTNEGGTDGTYRFLKNIMGLWILQECKREWDKDGPTDFAALMREAENASPFISLIDPDHVSFFHPGDMPAKIAAFCRQTGQPVPGDRGSMTRCILESLALKYRMVVTELEQLTGRALPIIHIMGGGSQNRLLNQFTASAAAKKVMSGPVEATAVGNLIVQLVALGEIANIAEGRRIIRRSFPVQVYEPVETDGWNEAYRRFEGILKGAGSHG